MDRAMRRFFIKINVCFYSERNSNRYESVFNEQTKLTRSAVKQLPLSLSTSFSSKHTNRLIMTLKSFWRYYGFSYELIVKYRE